MNSSTDPHRVWPIAGDYYDDLVGLGEISVHGTVHLPLGHLWVRRLTGRADGSASLVLVRHHVTGDRHWLTRVSDRSVHDWLREESRYWAERYEYAVWCETAGSTAFVSRLPWRVRPRPVDADEPLALMSPEEDWRCRAAYEVEAELRQALDDRQWEHVKRTQTVVVARLLRKVRGL